MFCFKMSRRGLRSKSLILAWPKSSELQQNILTMLLERSYIWLRKFFSDVSCTHAVTCLHHRYAHRHIRKSCTSKLIHILAFAGLNVKCDVWSCGCIMYLLLSGHLPFSGRTVSAIKQKVLRGNSHVTQSQRFSHFPTFPEVSPMHSLFLCVSREAPFSLFGHRAPHSFPDFPRVPSFFLICPTFRAVPQNFAYHPRVPLLALLFPSLTVLLCRTSAF